MKQSFSNQYYVNYVEVNYVEKEGKCQGTNCISILADNPRKAIDLAEQYLTSLVLSSSALFEIVSIIKASKVFVGLEMDKEN